MDRIPCCVPFCRRTVSARRFAEIVEPPDDCWICGSHWSAVPARAKAVKRRSKRALRQAPDDPVALLRFLRISRRCTRMAIERGAGL